MFNYTHYTLQLTETVTAVPRETLKWSNKEFTISPLIALRTKINSQLATPIQKRETGNDNNNLNPTQSGVCSVIYCQNKEQKLNQSQQTECLADQFGDTKESNILSNSQSYYPKVLIRRCPFSKKHSHVCNAWS